MNNRDQFLQFYQAHRLEDQKRFYESRASEFSTAYRQSLWLTVGLSLLTSLVAGLASVNIVGPIALWQALAVVLPLLSTGLAAYVAVYAFDRQAKLYQDAINALIRAAAEVPDRQQVNDEGEYHQAMTQYVSRVESILLRENNQWGQLISQIKGLQLPQQGSDETK